MKNLRVTLTGYGSDGVTVVLPEVDKHDLALLEMLAARLEDASTSTTDPFLTIGDHE